MHYDNISCQPLWNNDYIKIGNRLIYCIKLYKKGVRFANDILETKGDLFLYIYAILLKRRKGVCKSFLN